MAEAVTPDPPRTSLLIDLAYELLDAHNDAMALGSDISDPAWEAHMEYIRALQRRGREILALTAEDVERAERAVRTPPQDIFD